MEKKTDGNWLDVLACPIDGASLDRDTDALRCTQCQRVFPVVDGIPNFLDQLPLARNAAWGGAQDYELSYWTGRQQTQLDSRDARLQRAAKDLARLFDVRGAKGWRRRVLHVGPAGVGEVHYLDAAQRYAAEPLACHLQARGLIQRDGVRWVATMGEYLPFEDGFFSMILIPNVIDHVAQPQRVLKEIRRCVVPGGHVWLSCHVSSAWINPLFRCLHRLRVGYFAGHLWFYSSAALDRACQAAGFHTVWSRTEPLDAPTFVAHSTLRQRAKRRLLAVRYLLLRSV